MPNRTHYIQSEDTHDSVGKCWHGVDLACLPSVASVFESSEFAHFATLDDFSNVCAIDFLTLCVQLPCKA